MTATAKPNSCLPPMTAAATNGIELLRFARRLALFLLPLAVLLALVALGIDTLQHNRLLMPELQTKLQTLADSRQSYRLLVLGDSRAEMQVDPRQLAQELKLPPEQTLNLAVRAGDLSSVTALLRAHPWLLREKPVLLVSVSIFSFNDGATRKGYYSPDLVAACSWRQRWTLLGGDRLFAYYLDSAQRLLGLKEPKPYRDDPALRGLALEDGVLATDFDLRVAAWHDRHPWYQRLNLQGVRTQRSAADLHFLAQTGCPVLVFEGPIAPSWLRYIQQRVVEQSDEQFTALISQLCAERGLAFVSYRTRPGLSDEQFLNIQHLNPRGVPVFTHWLAQDAQALLRTKE